MNLDHGLDDHDTGRALVAAPAPPFVGGRWTLYTGELPVGAMHNACAITGKAPEPGARFVDIGFVVDDDTPNGDICLHEEYVRELGYAVGLIDRDLLDDAIVTLTALNEEIEQLRAELDLARDREPEPDLPAWATEIKAAVDDLAAAVVDARKRPARSKSTSKPTTKESTTDA